MSLRRHTRMAISLGLGMGLALASVACGGGGGPSGEEACARFRDLNLELDSGTDLDDASEQIQDVVRAAEDSGSDEYAQAGDTLLSKYGTYRDLALAASTPLHHNAMTTAQFQASMIAERLRDAQADTASELDSFESLCTADGFDT